MAATNYSEFSQLAPWGYPFLAVAGALVGANSLFGATTGHVRFASTQLLLEKIMTLSRIAWVQYLSESEASGPDTVKVGFELIKGYAEAVYSATLSETGNWSETVIAELNRHADEVLGKKNMTTRDKKAKAKPMR